MAGAVKLMPVPYLKAHFRLNGGEIAVAVAVIPLVGAVIVNGGVGLSLKLFIRSISEDICNGFNPLGNIGIPENMGLVGHALFPPAFKGLKPAGFAEPVIHGGHGYGFIDILPVFPEAGKGDIVKINLFHIAVLSGINKADFSRSPKPQPQSAGNL